VSDASNTSEGRAVARKKETLGADLIIPVGTILFAVYYLYTVWDLPWQAKAAGLGIAGAMALVLVLFGLLVLHGLTIASQARDRLGSLIATGVVTMMATQVFLNIGMTTGLIPIMGLPLPLMSYGGSSLITTCMCLGLLMNVQRRRFTF